MNDDQTPRPKRLLIDIGRRYPGCWRLFDEFRRDKGVDGPDWPDYCYAPIAVAYAIVSGGYEDRIGIHNVGDVGKLGALAAWRMTQIVYRFDDDLYAQLISGAPTGDIPAELLRHLPQWCVYIESPGLMFGDIPLIGFFSHIEYDIDTGRDELRFVFDTGSELIPYQIHLGKWAIDEAIDRMLDVSKAQAVLHGHTVLRQHVMPIKPLLISAVNLLLYLCSDKPDIAGELPKNPKPKSVKKQGRRAMHLFAAEKTSVIDVGVRIGSALRATRDAAGEPGDGSHASPRGHIRSAHWHTYQAFSNRKW